MKVEGPLPQPDHQREIYTWLTAVPQSLHAIRSCLSKTFALPPIVREQGSDLHFNLLGQPYLDKLCDQSRLHNPKCFSLGSSRPPLPVTTTSGACRASSTSIHVQHQGQPKPDAQRPPVRCTLSSPLASWTPRCSDPLITAGRQHVSPQPTSRTPGGSETLTAATPCPAAAACPAPTP